MVLIDSPFLFEQETKTPGSAKTRAIICLKVSRSKRENAGCDAHGNEGLIRSLLHAGDLNSFNLPKPVQFALPLHHSPTSANIIYKLHSFLSSHTFISRHLLRVYSQVSQNAITERSQNLILKAISITEWSQGCFSGSHTFQDGILIT